MERTKLSFFLHWSIFFSNSSALCFAIKGVSLFPLPCLPCNYLSTWKDTVVENLTVKFRERERVAQNNSGWDFAWLGLSLLPVVSLLINKAAFNTWGLRRFAPWVLKRGLSLMWPLLFNKEKAMTTCSAHLLSEFLTVSHSPCFVFSGMPHCGHRHDTKHPP